MHVSEATFVVTDTETTGTSAETDRLTEVAAVKLRGGTVIGRFEQLVNPERTVPAHISRMTGITTAMVMGEPPASEVLPRYLDFLGEGVLVAQNLSFDRKFLDAVLDRMGRPGLINETLCTLRLARRLLPGLKSKSLAALVSFYDLANDRHHRALSDAEATARILKKFLRQLAFEHEIETLAEVLTFQHQSYRTLRQAPKHLRHLRREVLPDLPDRPGVYFMKNRRGRTHYIGKAKSLRSRVRSYFNGVEAHQGRRRKLVSATREVDWQIAPSELDALLLESRLIKEKKPRFNRAGRRYRSRPFLCLDPTEAFPRLSWSYRLEEDEAAYYGPLRGRREAEHVLDVLSRLFQLRECDDEQLRKGQRCLYAGLDRCTAPCEGGTGAAAYDEALDRVRAFLTGRDDAVLRRVEERMENSAEQLDFEQAARYRDWRETLERFFARQQLAGGPVREYHAVFVLSKKEKAQLFLVRFGRHAKTMTVDRSLSEAGRQRVEEHLARIFDPEQERPDGYSKRETHEMRLLQGWACRRRDALSQVRWTGESASVLAEKVFRQIGRDGRSPGGSLRRPSRE